MPGRPLFARHEDWTLTPEESRRLTRNVDALDTPWVLRKPYKDDPDEYLRIHELKRCAVWTRLHGNITSQPVTDVAGVRARWER